MEIVRFFRPGCGSGRGVNLTCRDTTELCGSYVRGQRGENNLTRTVTGKNVLKKQVIKILRFSAFICTLRQMAGQICFNGEKIITAIAIICLICPTGLDPWKES